MYVAIPVLKNMSVGRATIAPTRSSCSSSQRRISDSPNSAAFVLLDGTLAECDRVGDSRADYSHEHRRHGVNVQVVTDPDGRPLWISPTLPGRAHDLTAVRTHRIIRICERQGVPILADLAYQGGGPWLTTGIKRRPPKELTPTEGTLNQALATARAPVERGVARLKSWRIFRKAAAAPTA